MDYQRAVLSIREQVVIERKVDEEMPSCIYVQLNDAVVDWAIAWFNSLHRTQCRLPVVILPWDGNTREIVNRFVRVGAATMVEGAERVRMEALAERVGRLVHPKEPRMWPFFHRLFPLVGAYKRFMFADADIVFVRDPGDICLSVERTASDFCYISRSTNCVYRPEELPAMREQYDTAEFNSGCFISRVGMFAEEDIVDAAARVAAPGGPLLDFIGDQPFMNYLIDSSRVRKDAIQSVIPGTAASSWPNPRREGEFIFDAPGGPVWSDRCEPENAGKAVWLLHWAGFEVSPWMPFRNLWESYRFEGRGPSARSVFWGSWWVKNGLRYAHNRTTELIGGLRRKYRG